MESRFAVVVCVCALGAVGGSAWADILWDNGPMDGLAGLSQLSSPGQRRSVIDDFHVDPGGWGVDTFSLKFAWADGSVNSGTALRLAVYADAGGAPDFGRRVALLDSSNYQEEVDPASPDFFGLRVVNVSVTTNKAFIAEGTYWLEMLMIGPVEGFQPTTRAGQGNAWVDYQDLGGRMSTLDAYGAGHDAVFWIGGNALPAPGAIGLLAAAAIAGPRRRRS